VHPPAIRDLFIQTAANSLDIQSLSELTRAFNLPVDQWPTVEFELAVDASPLRALPGEIVTFRVQIRNTGKRDAQRAEVTFGVSIRIPPLIRLARPDIDAHQPLRRGWRSRQEQSDRRRCADVRSADHVFLDPGGLKPALAAAAITFVIAVSVVRRIRDLEGLGAAACLGRTRALTGAER
jgi:hypothetical protein